MGSRASWRIYRSYQSRRGEVRSRRRQETSGGTNPMDSWPDKATDAGEARAGGGTRPSIGPKFGIALITSASCSPTPDASQGKFRSYESTTRRKEREQSSPRIFRFGFSIGLWRQFVATGFSQCFKQIRKKKINLKNLKKKKIKGLIRFHILKFIYIV